VLGYRVPVSEKPGLVAHVSYTSYPYLPQVIFVLRNAKVDMYPNEAQGQVYKTLRISYMPPQLAGQGNYRYIWRGPKCVMSPVAAQSHSFVVLNT
jgi:hypothetical protein